VTDSTTPQLAQIAACVVLPGAFHCAGAVPACGASVGAEGTDLAGAKAVGGGIGDDGGVGAADEIRGTG